MPLSEHEQRLLEQMERALYAEDPKLASALRHGNSRKISGKRMIGGALGMIIGLGVLIGGVATSNVILGVIGFLLMLGGVMLIASAARPAKPEATEASAAGGASQSKLKASTGKAAKGSSSFMSKVEDRWRRRRESDGL